MIDTTPELATWLDTVQNGVRIDLYTLTLATGQVLRWSGAETAILLPDGRVFARGPLLARSRVELRTGIEVGELHVEITPTGDDQLFGLPLLRYAREGGLRGTELLLEYGYFDVDRTYRGVIPRFYGRGSPSNFEGGTITLQVKSDTERLLGMVPADVYQPSCLNTVYDAKCGKSRTAMRITGTVASSTAGQRSSFGTGLGQAAGWFSKGLLRFTAGNNAGVSRTVRSFAAGGAFTFALPWPRDITVGDAFEVFPGCDGTEAMCVSKFNNKPRFRGQPHIPSPEVAL